MTTNELPPQTSDSQDPEEAAQIEALWASKASDGAIRLPTNPILLADLLRSLAEERLRQAASAHARAKEKQHP